MASIAETSFYAHYFDAGQEHKDVLNPRYTAAKSKNPFTNEWEYWMTLAFNSKVSFFFEDRKLLRSMLKSDFSMMEKESRNLGDRL